MESARAIKIAHELEPSNGMWLERSLWADNLMAYQTLSEHTSLPLCVSERLYARWGYRERIESRAASAIMLDVGWTGGLTGAKKIANLAETLVRQGWRTAFRWFRPTRETLFRT